MILHHPRRLRATQTPRDPRPKPISRLLPLQRRPSRRALHPGSKVLHQRVQRVALGRHRDPNQVPALQPETSIAKRAVLRTRSAFVPREGCHGVVVEAVVEKVDSGAEDPRVGPRAGGGQPVARGAADAEPDGEGVDAAFAEGVGARDGDGEVRDGEGAGDLWWISADTLHFPWDISSPEEQQVSRDSRDRREKGRNGKKSFLVEYSRM